MDCDSDSYNDRNAIIAWTKYFEYLERHKDSLLVKSEYIAFSVGFNLDSYFRNYLLHGEIPAEHESFINTNYTGLIAVFKAFTEMISMYNKPSIIQYEYVDHTILPYLYKIRHKNALSEKTFYICEDAHNYLFGKNNYKKNIAKALELYIKCLEEGAVNADAYIGICFCEMGQTEKADKSWKIFYNNVYDIITEEKLLVITDEEKQSLLESFYQIFYAAIKGNNLNLIHDFYYYAVWHLGFYDYILSKISLYIGLFSNSNESTISNLSVLGTGNQSTEIQVLNEIMENLQKALDKCQGDNWERPHRLDL